MDAVRQIIDFLEENTGNPNFAACRDEAVEKMKKISPPQQAIGPLLDFMSSHPNLDYGMPGAFVHFIETFAYYEHVEKPATGGVCGSDEAGAIAPANKCGSERNVGRGFEGF